ncbi:MAG: protein-L-isoaspartate O-methyltransferase [Acidithiobacillales bacterium SG8_45]|jgi:protein-L-isoaspartate(D-aspartate) O-methyltransferase|nr:MAG: protein-L-isoaspartate O-methyltransferase [Acidithiobacillales bacterium SG8_45]
MKDQHQGIGMTSQRTRDRLIVRLRDAGVVDERVLEVMASIPRHLFVDEALATRAYEDTALPIGHGQTISQPYIVALMTSVLLGEAPPQRVLEVGTGCGYQTAVLAKLVTEVYTVERLEPLMKSARRRLVGMGHRNIIYRLADGSLGWPEKAPFDAIITTAAAPELPLALREQLNEGGRLIIPVGEDSQELRLIVRTADGFTDELLELVNFVPLVSGKV